MEVQASPQYESIVDELNDLIALDYDAVAAYDAAINRLDDPAVQHAMGEFKSDHRRHIAELAQAVRSMGGNPREHGDYKVVLTKGKVLFAALRGDRPILDAMKSNEDHTNKAYERACEACMLAPPLVRDLLERNLADERRHRRWIVEFLGTTR